VALSAWEKLSPEEREGKFSVGVLHKDTTQPEYCDVYRGLQKRAAEQARIEAARAEAEAHSKIKDVESGAQPQ
jgi:hypothetical protein